MRQFKFALTLLAAAALAGCGGGSSSGGDQSTKVKFSSQVSFGDSLSDVGTYNVGTVMALGGGKYTVNGATSKNWTELMAAQFGLTAPCAAETGLEGDQSQGFRVPRITHSSCTSYAQGGARVTNPVGPGNALLGGLNAVLGQLTVPVVVQIQNHLALHGGAFKGDEAVFVLAGGNDALMELVDLSAHATDAGNTAGINSLIATLAAGTPSPDASVTAMQTALVTELANPAHTAASVQTAIVTAAVMNGFNQAQIPAASATATAAGQSAAGAYVQTNAPVIVTAMGTAGAQLAGYIKDLIVAKGAKYVTVVNLPDLSVTPYALSQSAATRDLITTMVTTFNNQLQTGLADNANVLVVDAYSANRDQYTNPGPYGLTNVTTPACDLSDAKNKLGSSLVCNATNVVAGDVSHYGYADSVHPTPFANLLLARFVSEQMAVKGWL